MNIALCTDTFIPIMGGTGMVVNALANEYIQKGHNVAVFTSDMSLKNINDSLLPYKVYRTHSYKMFPGVHTPFPNRDKCFNKKLYEFSPDVIHSHTPYAIGWWGIVRAKELHIPSVLTTHTYLNYMNDIQVPFSKKNPIHKAIVKQLSLQPKKASANCSILTAVSKSVVDAEIRKVYKLSRNVEIVRNGYTVNTEQNSTSNASYHMDNKITLAYAGQIDKTKNIAFSLWVCAELKKRSIPFEFNLAGAVNSKFTLPFAKNDMDRYIKLSKELGIESSVHFLGRLDKQELDLHYGKSDLFLFPSVYDTDGIVVKEAAAQGTPSLVIKDTGAAEQIEDGVNGWALDNDIDAFADKVEEIYNMKKNFPNKYLELRESTKNKPIPLWKDIANEYLALYQQRVE